MQRLKEFHKQFFSQAKDGVWVAEIDPPLSISLSPRKQVLWIKENTRIRFCNDAFAKGYGFPDARVLRGIDWSKLIAWFDEQNMSSLYRFVRHRYILERAEFRGRDAFGRSKYFLAKLQGVVEDGHLVRIWGTQRDITDWKQQQLRCQIFLERLTVRQRRVLELTANGFSLKEIAARMGISAKTVSTMRQRLLRRVGVRDTAGLLRSDIIAEISKQLSGKDWKTVKATTPSGDIFTDAP